MKNAYYVSYFPIKYIVGSQIFHTCGTTIVTLLYRDENLIWGPEFYGLCKVAGIGWDGEGQCWKWPVAGGQMLLIFIWGHQISPNNGL